MKYSLFVLVVFFVLFISGFAFFYGRRKKKRIKSISFEETHQIYVGNLPYHVHEAELKIFFSRFGTIKSMKIVKNFRTGQSKGYAFICYTTPNAAAKALAFSGQDFKGRSLVVQLAKSRDM